MNLICPQAMGLSKVEHGRKLYEMGWLVQYVFASFLPRLGLRLSALGAQRPASIFHRRHISFFLTATLLWNHASKCNHNNTPTQW